jgi:pilus assembly protein CpaF
MSLAERLDQARRSQQPAVALPRGNITALDPFAQVKESVHQGLIESLGPQLYDPHLLESDLEQRVRLTLQTVLEAENTPLSTADRTRISQEVADEILGHGPLEPLLRDPEITEIMVNGPNRIYVERGGKIFPVAAAFTSEAHLRRMIDKIAGRVWRRIDESSPMVDARLPDGSRVNAVVEPIALDGAMLTIRKFSSDPFTDRDLITFGTFTPQVRDVLEACVRGRLNIVISGGTGSGKTTLLNVISAYIPEDERIITIEDAAELQLNQEHVLRMEARPRTSRARVRSPFATWSGTHCVCVRTASWSARFVTAQRWTCSRR